MQSGTLFVQNHNDFTHTDSYDGVEYVFPPKEKVAIPREAAQHMFGFGKADKTETLQRLGWAFRLDPKKGMPVEDEQGIKRLARFAFTKAVIVEEKATAAA